MTTESAELKFKKISEFIFGFLPNILEILVKFLTFSKLSKPVDTVFNHLSESQFHITFEDKCQNACGNAFW